MANEDPVLEEILDNHREAEEADYQRSYANSIAAQAPPAFPDEDEDKGDKEKSKSEATFTQWAIGGNGKFSPVGATIATLGPGIYEPFAQPGMWGLEALPVQSDGIYELPDMATQTVLQEAQKFWDCEPKYRAHKLLYKRGIILTGPPGGGKTVTVKILMAELVRRGGIVVVISNVNLAIAALKAIRRIEPKRNLIVVMEDIDEIINVNGEAAVLSLLDGENNIDNVLNLATTNYPERLGGRIINRPSRFDRVIRVGMPGPESRKVYLQKTTDGKLTDNQLDLWVADTDGMSIAHLRELVASVYCLDQPYEEVRDRLKAMANQPKGEEEFRGRNMGFNRARKGGGDYF